MKTNKNIFDFDIEIKHAKDLFHKDGFKFVTGCDEAGRGPVAGPLYCAAVCFKSYDNLDKILPKLNDSKQLTEKVREELYPIIKENSFYCIKEISIKTIEVENILNASLNGMKKCAIDVIKNTGIQDTLVLIDGNKECKFATFTQKALIKGDSLSASIAAASILAKVTRDNYMLELHQKYPMYNFKKNKGYLTKEHIEAIKKFGISPFHRKTFLTNFIT